MARNLFALLEAKLVQHNVGIRPTTIADGVDITSWRTNGEFSSPTAALFLDASVAQTLSSPAGGTEGPELWGWRLDQWWRVGLINNGESIVVIGADQGFAQQIQTMGVFERLAVAATVSAGTCAAKLAPIEVWS